MRLPRRSLEREQGEGLRSRKLLRTREVILEAAKSLFLQKGFSATRIEDICREAEISLGTFYNFFRSKQEVLLFFLSTDRGSTAANLEAQLQRPVGDAVAYLHDLLMADVDIEVQGFSLPLWREILAAMILSVDDEASRVAIEAYRGSFRQVLGRALERIDAAGRLRPGAPREDLVEALYSVTAFQFQKYVCGEFETGAAYAEALRRLVDCLLRPWLAAAVRGSGG